MNNICCQEPFLEFESCDAGETWYRCLNCKEKVFQYTDNCGG